MMHIVVTYKVKNFEINPIFAKKVIKKKLTGGAYYAPLTLNRVKGDCYSIISSFSVGAI